MIETFNKRHKKLLAIAYSGSFLKDVEKNIEYSLDFHFNVEREFEGIKSTLGRPDSEKIELYIDQFEKILPKINLGNDILNKLIEQMNERNNKIKKLFKESPNKRLVPEK